MQLPGIQLNKLCIVLAISVVVFLPFSLHAEVDWQLQESWQAEDVPLDSAFSVKDGRLFLLTQSAVLIYSAAGTLEGRIPIEQSVARIAVSPAGDQLYLFHAQSKQVQAVSLEYIRQINTQGSPFMGAAGAAVEVVVFSDFQ